jgi:Protein of unknown function (DUF3592)
MNEAEASGDFMIWRSTSSCIGVAFLAVIFISFFVNDRRERARIAAGPSWPTTEGTISESQVRLCDKGVKRMPQVLYTYVVNGQSYEGAVTFRAPHCGAQQDAQAVVDAYPQGFAFAVHVDPTEPSNSLVLAP